jgi:antitoxin component YwqK of YwqJK toxin-antitoxin module
VYYESGYLKSVKMFSGNVANGSAYELYEDGSVKSECTYKKGEIKGKVKEYEQGKKFME